MSGDTKRLWRWTARARPSTMSLLRAVVAGGVASLANAALFVGALALLVASAKRPGLHAVAFSLIVIELFAFLRSPLRFGERLSAHRLGFDAVAKWRQWLVGVVGHLDFDEWRTYASGDLLQRALDDTDGLQDLWLRFLLPCVSTSVVLAVGDIVLASLPPHGHWVLVAVVLLVLQALGITALFANTRREFALDGAVRAARGEYRAALVEAGAVASDLELLGRRAFLDQRLMSFANRMSTSESRFERQQRVSDAIVVLVSVLSVLTLFLHATSSPTWIVVVAAIALATYDGLTTMRHAFAAAVHVNGSAQRLESMDHTERLRPASWPSNHSLSLSNVTLSEGGRTLLDNVSLDVACGSTIAVTGPSGSGKSTLLRALAGLCSVSGGAIEIGGANLTQLRENELRANVSYVGSEPGLTRGFARDVLSLGRIVQRDPMHDINRLGVLTEPTTRFDSLSRGERARVGVVQGSAIAPSIFLLDEPTSALGASETRAVLALLSELDATIIVATHDATVMEWCDVVLVLDDATLRPLSR